jgi:tripeptide aminopeptidase
MGKSADCKLTLRSHELEVHRLALLPDRTTLISGAKDGCGAHLDTAAPGWHGANRRRKPLAVRPGSLVDSKPAVGFPGSMKVSLPPPVHPTGSGQVLRRVVAPLFVALLIAPALPSHAASLAQREEVRRALALIEQFEPETLSEQVRLCEIPAPPFAEAERAEYFRRRFVELGLEGVRVDAEGNVLGFRPGRTKRVQLVFSAHLDTVFPPDTDVRVRREGTLLKAPGIADDARGLAVVLAVIRGLQETQLQTEGSVVFVGTVGEEGLGDLRGVRHLFEKELAGQVTHFISMDGTGLGVTSIAVGSHRYRVTFRSAGGHSYGAFGLVNPIHALGRAVEKIARFEVPAAPRTTFNVGRIEGGTSVNSISQSASFEIDLRSVSADALGALDGRFRQAIDDALREENDFWEKHARNPIARTTNRGTPVTAHIERVGLRPTGRVPEDAPILQAVRRANDALGIEHRFEEGSTDSNFPISLGIPAVTLHSGGASTGNHALQEQFDTRESHRGTQRAFLTLLEIVGLAE